MKPITRTPLKTPPPRIGWHYDTYFLKQLEKHKQTAATANRKLTLG